MSKKTKQISCLAKRKYLAFISLYRYRKHNYCCERKNFLKHFGRDVPYADIVAGTKEVSQETFYGLPENLPVKRCTQFKVATSVRPEGIKGQTRRQVYR